VSADRHGFSLSAGEVARLGAVAVPCVTP
jgi:hypothetical protein